MSDETLAVVLTLTSFGLLLYTYVGYPALLWLLNRVIPAPENLSTEPAEWPQVSIILSAYNEENVIADRLKNLLDLDYPRERLEIQSIQPTRDSPRRVQGAKGQGQCGE